MPPSRSSRCCCRRARPSTPRGPTCSAAATPSSASTTSRPERPRLDAYARIAVRALRDPAITRQYPIGRLPFVAGTRREFLQRTAEFVADRLGVRLSSFTVKFSRLPKGMAGRVRTRRQRGRGGGGRPPSRRRRGDFRDRGTRVRPHRPRDRRIGRDRSRCRRRGPRRCHGGDGRDRAAAPQGQLSRGHLGVGQQGRVERPADRVAAIPWPSPTSRSCRPSWRAWARRPAAA